MTPLLKISESLVESVPKSSPPWIWVGFLLVFVFFLLETLMVLLELDERRMTAFLTLIAISGSIYWFVCVHRLHKILVEITKGRYPITGAQSVGMHFIPFYNFYWIFKWPAVMTDYLNGQRRVQIISGYLLGVFILIGALLRWEVDSGAGLFILFSVTLYLSLKLKEHVKLIRAALPENLPPLPDPKNIRPPLADRRKPRPAVVDQNRVDYISRGGGTDMKNYQLRLVVLVVALFGLQSIVVAQTRRPALRKRTTVRRVVPLVPVGTDLKVRINDTLSSKDSRIGDRFTATVIDPSRFDEAKVYGHISSIQKSGKIKGRTSMNLAFDSVELRDGRKEVMHGYVTRVYGEGSGRADNEGGVESGSRTKQTVKRAGIGATVGAIVGGIAGGGKGAAIGLIIGGAGGAGSLAINGSKELKIESGTEMLVHVTR